MNFNKKTILDALKSPDFCKVPVDKNTLIDNLHKMTSSTSVDKSVDNVINNLTEFPDSMNEAAVKLHHIDVKNIIKSVVLESANTPNISPNAFRLDLKSIVIDKCHGKFVINRKNNNVTIDIIYPNANDKITVKNHIDGMDDKVYEVGLEDDQYTGDFGLSIIKSVDEMLNEKQQKSIEFRNPSQFSNPEINVSGFSPNWVQNGYSMESAAAIMKNLLTLIEAGEDKDEKDKSASETDNSNDVDNSVSDLDQSQDAAGDVNSDAFGKDDFSLNGSPDMGGGTEDLGGDLPSGGGIPSGGSSDLGMPNGDMGGSDINSDGENSNPNASPDDDYENFKDFAVNNFSTIKNGTIDVLSDIVSDALGKQLDNSSEGVKLTNAQILNGMPGLKTRPAIEIIDAFLKLYPSLNGEFKKSDLETLSEKLEERPTPNEFNQFLEGFIKKMQGENANDTDVLQLPNAPLEKPMGGEQPQEQTQPDEFSTFIDKSNEMTGNNESNSEEVPNPETSETDKDVDEALKRTAELETNVPPKREEYPNI